MTTRNSLLALATLAGIAMVGASASQAMTIAPLDQVVAENSIVSQTFGGCGWGGHRGPFGGCRPLFNCPPGWHTGPWGRHCFRNW